MEKRLRGGFSIWGDYEVRFLLEVFRIPILTITRSKTFGTERYKPRHGERPLNTRLFLKIKKKNYIADSNSVS